MKYIRTGYGIYKSNEYLLSIKDLESIAVCKELGINSYKDVKTANTIEKLIDELVIHNPSNDGYFYPKHFVYQNKWETMLKPISDYQKSKGIEIYGAIWTDKGLIYVAKLNEKGELELL